MQEGLDVEVCIERLLWIEERVFTHDGFDIHSLVMYYLVHLPSDSVLHDHDTVYHFEDGGTQCLCKWHALNELNEIVFYPEFLREALHRIPESPEHIVVRENEP